MLWPTASKGFLGIVLSTLSFILFVPLVAGGEPPRRLPFHAEQASPRTVNTHHPTQSVSDEKLSPENLRRLSRERRLAFHTRFLRDVARSSPVIEVAWEMEDVRRSLRFIAENGAGASGKTARVVAEIFSRTEDAEAKHLCLLGLNVIGTKTAREKMLGIYHGEGVDERWQALIAEYLKLPAPRAAGAACGAHAETRQPTPQR